MRTEEGGRIAGDSSAEWIIDPVDGTVNFSRHSALGNFHRAYGNAVNPPPALSFSAWRSHEMYTAVRAAALSATAKDTCERNGQTRSRQSNGDWQRQGTGKRRMSESPQLRTRGEVPVCTRQIFCGAPSSRGRSPLPAGSMPFNTMSYPWDIAGHRSACHEAAATPRNRTVPAPVHRWRNGGIHQWNLHSVAVDMLR